MSRGIQENVLAIAWFVLSVAAWHLGASPFLWTAGLIVSGWCLILSVTFGALEHRMALHYVKGAGSETQTIAGK